MVISESAEQFDEESVKLIDIPKPTVYKENDDSSSSRDVPFFDLGVVGLFQFVAGLFQLVTTIIFCAFTSLVTSGLRVTTGVEGHIASVIEDWGEKAIGWHAAFGVIAMLASWVGAFITRMRNQQRHKNSSWLYSISAGIWTGASVVYALVYCATVAALMTKLRQLGSNQAYHKLEVRSEALQHAIDVYNGHAGLVTGIAVIPALVLVIVAAFGCLLYYRLRTKGQMYFRKPILVPVSERDIDPAILAGGNGYGVEDPEPEEEDEGDASNGFWFGWGGKSKKKKAKSDADQEGEQDADESPTSNDSSSNGKGGKGGGGRGWWGALFGGSDSTGKTSDNLDPSSFTGSGSGSGSADGGGDEEQADHESDSNRTPSEAPSSPRSQRGATYHESSRGMEEGLLTRGRGNATGRANRSTEQSASASERGLGGNASSRELSSEERLEREMEGSIAPRTPRGRLGLGFDAGSRQRSVESNRSAQAMQAAGPTQTAGAGLAAAGLPAASIDLLGEGPASGVVQREGFGAQRDGLAQRQTPPTVAASGMPSVNPAPGLRSSPDPLPISDKKILPSIPSVKSTKGKKVVAASSRKGGATVAASSGGIMKDLMGSGLTDDLDEGESTPRGFWANWFV